MKETNLASHFAFKNVQRFGRYYLRGETIPSLIFLGKKRDL